MSRLANLAGAHWYPPVVASMLLGVWFLARTPAFMAAGGEAALLIDLCITAPVLYMLCYARRQSVRRTLVRSLAIACAGVWAASWLIPAEGQTLLPQLTPLRWTGLAVITLFELRLLVAAVRVAFSRTGTAKDIADASDAPEWIGRLMLLEARFWRAVWRLVRGRDKSG